MKSLALFEKQVLSRLTNKTLIICIHLKDHSDRRSEKTKEKT